MIAFYPVAVLAMTTDENEQHGSTNDRSEEGIVKTEERENGSGVEKSSPKYQVETPSEVENSSEKTDKVEKSSQTVTNKDRKENTGERTDLEKDSTTEKASHKGVDGFDEENSEDVNLQGMTGNVTGDVTYDVQKGYYVLDVDASLEKQSHTEDVDEKWLAFALPEGVDVVVEDMPEGIVFVGLPNGHTGLAMKVPNQGNNHRSMTYHIPLVGEGSASHPHEAIYLMDIDVKAYTYENLGQLNGQREIDFSVMESEPALDLQGVITGETTYVDEKGYYILDVQATAQNHTNQPVNDLYAGFRLPESVAVLQNDDTPEDISVIDKEDGTQEVALKLSSLDAGEEDQQTYAIPLLGKATENIKASTIPVYTISEGSFQSVGHFVGQVTIDLTNMSEEWAFDAESKLTIGKPDFNDNAFELYFGFKVINLLLDDVEQVNLEFKVPDGLNIREPNYEDGTVSGENVDIVWNGNTASADLHTVSGIGGYEGEFTAFGESTVHVNDLEGLIAHVTLYQEDSEKVAALELPIEVVTYGEERLERSSDVDKQGDSNQSDEDGQLNDGGKSSTNDRSDNGNQSGDIDPSVVQSGQSDRSGDDDQVTKVDKSDSNGSTLPNTAINMYTLFLIGALLIIGGSALNLFRKKIEHQ